MNHPSCSKFELTNSSQKIYKEKLDNNILQINKLKQSFIDEAKKMFNKD